MRVDELTPKELRDEVYGFMCKGRSMKDIAKSYGIGESELRLKLFPVSGAAVVAYQIMESQK